MEVLIQMCRLCLSRDMNMTGIFKFSSEFGKEIADIIMECAPIQITRHDKKPAYICRLCVTHLRKFHQFQMQAVQSDRTLQHHVQQSTDCHPQIKVELGPEEHSNNSVSHQEYNTNITTKCEPFEISDGFETCFSKQKVLANFSAIKSEIKDEPMDDDSLIPAACVATEISYDDSMIEFVDIKGDVDTQGSLECSLNFENGITETIPVKSEETYIPLREDDSSLCSKNIKDIECLRPNEHNLNKTEHRKKCQKLLKKSATCTGEKSYQCDICQKPFKELGNLKKHNLIHTGEKPYQCPICKMCFSLAHILKRHSLIHTGEKPHQCDICQQGFRQASQLQSHKLKHTGEKPYKCDICKMCFSESGNLKKHNLIHTGEKPYQCDICQMCFRRADELKSHKLKHTGEKPYKCDICKMCFSIARNLKRHNLIHTGEKPYRCDICEMCFRHSNSLKSHKLKHTE